ncbi:MAG: putative tricarboxylic transport rane protein [Burkholderiales bacterium]
MSLQIRNPKEFWSGVMFTIFGASALFIGREYTVGSAGRMGPGYFPAVLGGILTLLGLIAVARSFFGKGVPLGEFAIKETFLILLAVVLFGVLLRGAGLLVAVTVLVMVSAYASGKFEWKSTLALAIGGAIFCAAVFVLGLGVPMPLGGSWFGF